MDSTTRGHGIRHFPQWVDGMEWSESLESTHIRRARLRALNARMRVLCLSYYLFIIFKSDIYYLSIIVQSTYQPSI